MAKPLNMEPPSDHFERLERLNALALQLQVPELVAQLLLGAYLFPEYMPDEVEILNARQG